MFRRRVGLSLCALLLASCTTYRDVKEIKTVGFSDDLSQGKPSGQIDSDDCVFKVMGYALGGYPEVSRAINNARTGKKSKITDGGVFALGTTDTDKPLLFKLKADGQIDHAFGSDGVVEIKSRRAERPVFTVGK